MEGEQSLTLGTWSVSSRSVAAKVMVTCLTVAMLLSSAWTPAVLASDKVTMEFREAPLPQVFTSLAHLAGFNVLIDDAVTGHATLALKDESARDVIELIARLHGYAVEPVGNTLVITSPDRSVRMARADEVVLYRAENIDVQQAAAFVRQVFPEVGVIVDEGSRRLALSGSKTQLAMAVAFLADIDEPTPLQFVRTPVGDVLMALAERAGWFLILDGDFDTPVTALLEGMDFEHAVDLISEAAGLQYRLEGRALFVSEAAAVNAHLPVMVDAEQIETTRVVRVDYVETGKVREALAMVYPDVKVTVDEATRQLVLKGLKADLDGAAELVGQYDTPPGQVYVEARVEEISLDALRQLGIKWDANSVRWSGSDTPASLIIPWTASRLDAELDALAQDGQSHLLASPRLAALDGREARILIGDRIPLIIKTEHPEGGISEELTYIEAGIGLEITPLVGRDGYITLDIMTEVSSVTGFTTQNVPELRTREAFTRVRVKDGQPLIIGGLIQDEERIAMSGIPILKNLPLFGQLFRSEKIDHVQSETVIFLTPRIVTDGDETPTIQAAVTDISNNGEMNPAGASTSVPNPVGSAAAGLNPAGSTTMSSDSAMVAQRTAQPTLSSPLSRSAALTPQTDHRLARTDLRKTIAGIINVELEAPYRPEQSLISRLQLKQIATGSNWGIGLGMRRYVPLAILGGTTHSDGTGRGEQSTSKFNQPWVDLMVDYLRPAGHTGMYTLSARLGAIFNVAGSFHVEPYVEYRLHPATVTWPLNDRLSGGLNFTIKY